MFARNVININIENVIDMIAVNVEIELGMSRYQILWILFIGSRFLFK